MDRKDADRLIELEHDLVGLIEKALGLQSELAALDSRVDDAFFAELTRIREADPEEIKAWLDLSIPSELRELLYKLRMVDGKKPPSPDFQWLVIKEMLRLLIKLIFKTWILQNMRPPEIPPWPEPGPGPGPQPPGPGPNPTSA